MSILELFIIWFSGAMTIGFLMANSKLKDLIETDESAAILVFWPIVMLVYSTRGAVKLWKKFREE